MTDIELVRARATFLRAIRIIALVAFVLIGVFTYLAAVIASTITTGSGAQHLVTALLLALACAPVVLVAVRLVLTQVARADQVADARQHRLDEQARQRDLESTLADALEMAETEEEALRVIERGFAVVVPDQPVELLLADNSHAHLSRRATTAPDGRAAGCSVASPQDCPAARRARTHHFADSAAINACPKLADREQGRCAALCIPVSVMGRAVGVIHSVHEVGSGIDATSVKELQSIANQAGARLGMLRIMAETQLQASTDGLTGLLNRRAFENEFVALRGRSRDRDAVVIMADLDRFKTINDTYGHETGDRALRTFAETLRAALRDKDLLCRHGGEEFALVFPDCDLPQAVQALERVRAELRTTIRQAGLPDYTASFGVTVAHFGDDLDTLLAHADAALFQAKHGGRDRISVNDHNNAARNRTPTSQPHAVEIHRITG